MAKISSIRNLGPAMETAFEKAGLSSAQELYDLGAEASYGRLLASGHGAHFMAYCALALGLQGRPWQDCTKAEKAKLRAEYDRIRANVVPAENTGLPPALARVLDEIGLREA